MASIKSSSSLDFKFLFVLCSLSHLSAAQSISSAVFLIAFSYPPKSIHLSHGIKSDTNISPNNSNSLLMEFKSWLSSATSSSPKSMHMERFMTNLENHCLMSTTTAPEVGSLLEQLKQDNLSDFTPVLPVWGHRKHGVVVAQDFSCHEFGPRALPIIGHLHLLAGGKKTPTHLILASMADKYGPIFRMRLGSVPVLVVSDSKIAKECFTAKDKELATRPKLLAYEIMGYNYSMFGIAPYGEYWREIRKIVLLELLSNRRIEMLRKVRESHVRKAIKRTFDHWSHNKDPNSGAVVVEMRQWFSRLIVNLSIAMLFGEEEVGEESQLLKSIRSLLELFGEMPVSDFIPWLRWMDLGGYEKAMRKTAEEMDCAADRWLKEHRAKRDLKSKEEEDFGCHAFPI
nr:cytochrome P450 CYP82D47-like [Ipomoea batatas]